MARCPTLTLTAATLVVAAIIADRLLSPPPTREQLPAKSIYEFTAVDIRGQETSIADIARGKVTLIVNTASKCGYAHVYDDLQRLYEKYGPLGFTVLGFPCDQFLGQELDDEAAIDEFVCSAFHVTFPMFSKVDVNGAGTHPLFRFLKASLPGPLGLQFIPWNFNSFLVDRSGRPFARFSPTHALEAAVSGRIETALSDLTAR